VTIRLLILADDFTGALDTGVCFARHGIPTAACTGLFDRAPAGRHPLRPGLPCGGDTCRAVLAALDVQWVTVYHAIQDGVPLAACELPGRRIHLVTKSGGLGRQDVVAAICRFLQENITEVRR
jgi:uncharacterized protein YgbK (DUF1537 family)